MSPSGQQALPVFCCETVTHVRGGINPIKINRSTLLSEGSAFPNAVCAAIISDPESTNCCSCSKGVDLWLSLTDGAINGIVFLQECSVDEDCRKDHFCQTDMLESKCLRQRAQNQNCTRDGECRTGHLCIWGRCKPHAEKGQSGSICEQQRDCRPDLCCALHAHILFPVCTPLPSKGQPCLDHTHRLLDLITWEMEPEGAFDRCPCSEGLICRHEGNTLVSVCNDSGFEQGSIVTDPSRYVGMGDLPFLQLMAREHPEDGESYEYTTPDIEEVGIVERAAFDSVRGLYDQEHQVVWNIPEGEDRDGRERDQIGAANVARQFKPGR
ncbi:dickkopf-related protein 3-like [Heptranchias perlo]|uniref:dickkopf-related protein 3-like n=1 Tax=Heptranchias perlo TaxID=212740 RepID=UPI0035596F68